MRYLVFITLGLFLIAWADQANAAQPTQDQPMATLRVLDKVTARVDTVNVPLDSPLTLGGLTVTVRACRDTPAEEMPESAAFIEITQQDSTPKTVFSGWMFASSPALSAFEHPTYDVWVIGCKAAATTGPTTN